MQKYRNYWLITMCVSVLLAGFVAVLTASAEPPRSGKPEGKPRVAPPTIFDLERFKQTPCQESGFTCLPGTTCEVVGETIN